MCVLCAGPQGAALVASGAEAEEGRKKKQTTPASDLLFSSQSQGELEPAFARGCTHTQKQSRAAQSEQQQQPALRKQASVCRTRGSHEWSGLAAATEAMMLGAGRRSRCSTRYHLYPRHPFSVHSLLSLVTLRHPLPVAVRCVAISVHVTTATLRLRHWGERTTTEEWDE